MHPIHRSLVAALAAATVLAHAAPAQIDATTRVVRGCLTAAPPGSLRTGATSIPLFRHDANARYVFEAESTPLAGSWVRETAVTGHSGGAYLRWNGRNMFNAPGNGVLTYLLWCDLPQRFRLQMHNRHDHPDPSEENDCWMSINGSTWRKIYSNDNRNAGVWNWHTRVDPGHGFLEFDLAQGLNELRVSGRSANFKLDRIHVFPRAVGRLEDLSLPPSTRLGQRPVLGTSVDLEIGDPQGTARLTAGATQAVLLVSAAPARGACGLRVPGFGADGGPGELLLATASPLVVVPVGSWHGATAPAVLSLAVPSRAALAGSTLHAQALLLDLGRSPLRAVLTERLDLTLGDR